MVTDVIELRIPGDCDYPGGSKIPSQMLLFEVKGCNTEEQRVVKYGRERDMKSEAWICVMMPQTKGCQGMSTVTRQRE